MAIASLLDALEHDAERDAREVVDAARAEAERIRAEAEARVAQRCGAALAAHESELRLAADAHRARARREARARVLNARSAFLERVFRAVSAELPNVLESAAQRDALQHLAREALQYFPSTPAVIRCSGALADRLTGVAASVAELRVVRDESVVAGVIVEAADASLTIDNTLAARLDWLRAALSVEITKRFEETS